MNILDKYSIASRTSPKTIKKFICEAHKKAD